MPRDLWLVEIREHHEGYASFEQCLKNLDVIDRNRTNSETAKLAPVERGGVTTLGVVFWQRWPDNRSLVVQAGPGGDTLLLGRFLVVDLTQVFGFRDRSSVSRKAARGRFLTTWPLSGERSEKDGSLSVAWRRALGVGTMISTGPSPFPTKKGFRFIEQKVEALAQPPEKGGSGAGGEGGSALTFQVVRLAV
jgi:hypothetical protein